MMDVAEWLDAPTEWPYAPTKWPYAPTKWPYAPTKWPYAPTKWPDAPTKGAERISKIVIVIEMCYTLLFIIGVISGEDYLEVNEDFHRHRGGHNSRGHRHQDR